MLFSQQGEDQGQQEADDDTGHEGEIKGEFIPLDNDIPGEPPDPGDLIPQDHDQPKHRESYAKYYQDLSQTAQG